MNTPTSMASTPNSAHCGTNLELQYVKTLFFRNEHRPCIAVGEALLMQLSTLEGRLLHVHRAYIHFFLALAQEDLARQMYNQSRFKIARLDVAERHFCEALTAMAAFQQTGSRESRLPTPVKSRRGLPRHASSFSLLTIAENDNHLPPVNDMSLRQVELMREHIRCMKERCHLHIALMQQAKTRVLASQTKRTAARTEAWAQAKGHADPDTPVHAGKKLQPSKSFWMFTPDAIKTTEKERRMQDGRARGWARQRFDPSRYIALAESALAEL